MKADAVIVCNKWFPAAHTDFYLALPLKKDLIAIGDTISLTCGALAYEYSDHLNWYRDESLLESNKGTKSWNLNCSSSELAFILQMLKLR